MTSQTFSSSKLITTTTSNNNNNNGDLRVDLHRRGYNQHQQQQHHQRSQLKNNPASIQMSACRADQIVETKFFPARKRQCPAPAPALALEETSSSDEHDDTIGKKFKFAHVKKATKLRYDHNEDYKMTSKDRGICLIINNVDFEVEFLPQRKGSDQDALRFRDIYRQLGFQVDCLKNLTAEKMKSQFSYTQARCLPRHDALMIFLLSHGTEGGVYGTDGVEVDLNDMLNYFDNINCKQLMGKPKVFFFQCCRGRQIDYGVRIGTQVFLSQPESQGHSQSSQLSELNPNILHTKTSRWSELDREFNPTRTDMLLCFSCQQGYGSIRNEDYGSWLGASLAQNMEQYANNKHLMDIMNMVSRDIKLRQSQSGYKQVLEVTSIGFDRHLYFNPGFPQDSDFGKIQQA